VRPSNVFTLPLVSGGQKKGGGRKSGGHSRRGRLWAGELAAGCTLAARAELQADQCPVVSAHCSGQWAHSAVCSVRAAQCSVRRSHTALD